MKLKQSIPLGLGVVLAVVAIAVIGAAMLLTDKGEELGHFYKDYKSTQQTRRTQSNNMELMGRWRGLQMVAATSPMAQALTGRTEVEGGVVVAEVTDPQTRAAGLRRGDVITKVDNKPVMGLAGLYNVAKTTDPQLPAVVELNRGGQKVAAVLPCPNGGPGQGRGAGQGNGAGAGQGTVWGAGVPVAQPAQRGRNFYCPRDGTILPMGSVASPFCPRCQGPLHIYPPTPR